MNRHEIKKKRLETTYRQVISELLLFEMADSRVTPGSITITRVHINQNLTEAEVYFTSMLPENPNKLTKALYSAESFFLATLKKKVKIKYLPKIKFRYDRETIETNNMLDLIDRLSKDYTSNKKNQKNDI